MGRKNETARLKINTNNGLSNMRLYLRRVYPCVCTYINIPTFFSPPTRVPKDSSTAMRDPRERFILSAGMQRIIHIILLYMYMSRVRVCVLQQ